MSNVVSVAQLAEHQVVVLRVEGSIPSTHPSFFGGVSMVWFTLSCLYYYELFFGIMLIFFGITSILKAFFKFNLPLWPIFWGVVLVYLGFGIIADSLRNQDCSSDKIYRIK